MFLNSLFNHKIHSIYINLISCAASEIVFSHNEEIDTTKINKTKTILSQDTTDSSSYECYIKNSLYANDEEVDNTFINNTYESDTYSDEDSIKYIPIEDIISEMKSELNNRLLIITDFNVIKDTLEKNHITVYLSIFPKEYIVHEEIDLVNFAEMLDDAILIVKHRCGLAFNSFGRNGTNLIDKKYKVVLLFIENIVNIRSIQASSLYVSQYMEVKSDLLNNMNSDNFAEILKNIRT